MKTAILLIAVYALYSGASQAQTRKCTLPDGRVTYSDVMCSTAATSQTVNTNANTVDHSGMRREIDQAELRREIEAQRLRDIAERAAVPVKAVRPSAPQDCKFPYYTFGDDKGKRLSEAAKKECQANNQAKLDGGPTSLEAYGFWRDHGAAKDASRQAAIGRAQANTQAIQSQINSINTPPPRLTCKPNIDRRSLDCQ